MNPENLEDMDIDNQTHAATQAELQAIIDMQRINDIMIKLERTVVLLENHIDTFRDAVTGMITDVANAEYLNAKTKLDMVILDLESRTKSYDALRKDFEKTQLEERKQKQSRTHALQQRQKIVQRIYVSLSKGL